MIVSPNALLLVAHPGHELLLHGWVEASRPLVAVLTDGSGHSGESRLSYTRDLLAAVGARESSIFGTFTDRDAYLVIRQGRADVVTALVEEVAELLVRHRIETVVCDAME